MVSEIAEEIERLIPLCVLILVVMEDGLRVARVSRGIGAGVGVLILVVMEDGLRARL